MKKEKNFTYSFFKAIYFTIITILYRPKFIGKDNIPKEGAVILAGNHKHALDPTLVMMSTNRVVHFLAKAELFKGIHGKIFEKIGLIKVDRKKSNPLAIKKSKEILNNEGVIGIFPEGTRNKTKEVVLRFHHGAVTLAKSTNSKIVPFAIKGEYKLFRNNLIIEFGKPYNILEEEEVKEANDDLKKEIVELLRK